MTVQDESLPTTTIWLEPSEVDRRSSQATLTNYITQVRCTVEQYFRDARLHRGLDVLVGFILIPDAAPSFDLQALPWIDEQTAEGLAERLQSLESPPVWQGPILAHTQITIGNGCGWATRSFVLPFSTQIARSSHDETSDAYIRRYLEFVAQRRRRLSTVLGSVFWSLTQRYLPSAVANLIPKSWKSSPQVPRIASSLPTLPVPPAEEMIVPRFLDMPADQVDDFIQKFPNDIVYRHERIRAAIRTHEHGAVATACQEALNICPDDLWTQLTLVESLRFGGDSAGALKHLAEMVRTHPRFPFSYELRSQIYAELGAVKQSTEEADRAIDLYPRCPRLRQWRARLRAVTGRYADAIDDLTIARLLDPHDAETYGWRAFIRCRSGETMSADSSELTAAFADIEHALRLNSDSVLAHLARAELHLTSDHFDEAIADCNWILERHTGSADTFACRGAAYLQQNRVQDAIIDLSAALRLGSQLGYVGPLLIDAQHRLGDSSAALATADQFIAQHGDYLPVLLRRQALLQELGHLTEALEVINTIIDLQPTLAMAFSERGNVYRGLEKLSAADRDYVTAAELGAGGWAMILNHAMTLFDLKRPHEALVKFDQGIAEMPTLPLAYLQRGRVHAELEHYDLAIADFTEAIRQDEEHFEAYRLRACCHVCRKDYLSAIRDLDQLVQHAPSEAAFCSRAQAKILNGDIEAADLDIQQAIAHDQSHAEEFRVFQHLTEARFHFQRADYDAAIRASSDALEIDSNCLTAIRSRASAYWYGNLLVEAIDDFTRAIDIAGANSSDLSGRGQVYGELGEYELSLADLDESIALADEDTVSVIAYSHSGRGAALTGLKRHEEAAAAFEQSIRLCGGNAWVHYHHGLLYLELDKVREATLCFRLALQLISPALRPRQRARTIAFLANHKQSGNSEP